MQIKRMGESFSICKVEDYSDTDLTSEFSSSGRPTRRTPSCA